MLVIDYNWDKVGYFEKQTPEDNGCIEFFHYSMRTDYIRVTYIEPFVDAPKQIE